LSLTTHYEHACTLGDFDTRVSGSNDFIYSHDLSPHGIMFDDSDLDTLSDVLMLDELNIPR
jgi:hypothetical protein